MKVTWESQEKLTILFAKVAEIAYPVDADYKDDSKEIFKSAAGRRRRWWWQERDGRTFWWWWWCRNVVSL